MTQLQTAAASPLYYPPAPRTDPQIRPPLGLPPGSVRAAMTVVIGGLFWALLLFSERSRDIPLHLYFLLGLELLFVISHGHTIGPEATGRPSPLWLPRGFFRGFLLLGFLLTLGWELYQDPQLLLQRLTPSAEQLAHWPVLLLSAGAGFLVGRLLQAGPWERSYWFRDIQAWVSLVAMFALAAEILIVGFINPSMPQELNLAVWNYILTGIVFCYFAIRC